jgi:exportin-2 (importin alpha re-exporter)
MANLWMQRGNIPALVRLLRAFLEKGTSVIIANNQLPAIKDIIRFLLPSKANDPYGCELVEALFQNISACAI